MKADKRLSGGGSGERELSVKGQERIVWRDVLGLDLVVVIQLHAKTHQYAHLKKWVNFITCKLYLNQL